MSLHGDTSQGVHRLDALNLIAPEDEADDIVVIGQEHIHRFALHPEVTPVEVDCFVARVEAVHQQAQELIPVDGLPHAHLDGGLVEVLGITDTIDAGDGRDHDHISSAGEQ